MAEYNILTVQLQDEHDVVLARQRARHIVRLLGLDNQEQTRVATAVSEIARNAQRYAGSGKVGFSIATDGEPRLVVRVVDRGPGVRDLEAVLGGRYRSTSGMGIGIVGAKRLMDGLEIDTLPGGGTTVTMVKRLPRGERVGRLEVDRVVSSLALEPPRSAVDEIQAQNQELLQAVEEQRRALDALRERQAEVQRLNVELQETNRGVLALYAELDEKAEQLRRVSDQKTRFLSHMSHEFRTPLGSIRSIARLLLDRMDGELNPEQERQVRFIQSSAEELTHLVDDLLDLAKIEAGRLDVSIEPVAVSELIAALRGMFRPIVADSRVTLIFEDENEPPTLRTDERKVAQILRNFISNALKFTAEGHVRLSVTHDADSETVSFTVSDTGIGIAPEMQATIFDEFSQIDSPQQRRVKGTGLGLSVSQRLAALLGGKITLRSTPGVGSAFTLTLPLVASPPQGDPVTEEAQRA